MNIVPKPRNKQEREELNIWYKEEMADSGMMVTTKFVYLDQRGDKTVYRLPLKEVANNALRSLL